MIELYLIDLNKKKFDFNNLYYLLPVNVKNRVDKYKIVADKNRSIIAWYIVTKKLNLSNTELLENEYGKPYIKGKCFSISHSNNMVGVLFSNDECGLDIEKVDPKHLKIANKILSNEESNYANNIDYIIRKWTMIESYSKYIGTGFSFDLIHSLPNYIKSYKIVDSLNNNYYYSICFKNIKNQNIKIYFNFEELYDI